MIRILSSRKTSRKKRKKNLRQSIEDPLHKITLNLRVSSNLTDKVRKSRLKKESLTSMRSRSKKMARIEALSSV